MKRLFILVCGFFLLLAQANVARAITAIARDFDALVSRADTVFKGAVTAQTSQWVGEGGQRHIVTLVTFQVHETYKGAPAATQTLRFLGGTVGEDTMRVSDMPQFVVGQTAILFVVNNGKQFCPLVGAAQGRFRVTKDAGTGREQVFTDEGYPVTDTQEIGQLDEAGAPRLKRRAQIHAEAMTTEQFKAEILGKAAALAH